MRYSNDLRKKVLDLIINEKKRQKEIANLLKIDKSTIQRWYKKYKETKNTNYETNYRTGRPSKIEDLDNFQEFININSNLNLNDLAKKYSSIIKTKISKSTIHSTIKNKLNYTFKKKAGYIVKETKN